MKIQFSKYQGTGNDFIVIDNRDGALSLTNAQVHFLCNRRFGIGGDGLMLLQSSGDYDFRMLYYNSDGNEGSMCGNGGRCLVKFAYDAGMHNDIYHFIASDGEHFAEFADNGWVRLKMKDVHGVEQEHGDFILDTGSPHFIKPVHDIDEYDVVSVGRKIRYSKRFEEKGINVNFVEPDEMGGIYVRTYERGVEDETLSCGTGVTASALVFAHNDFGFNHVDVKAPGGQLAVEFDKTGDTEFSNIWLCGPATFVFKGEIAL